MAYQGRVWLVGFALLTTAGIGCGDADVPVAAGDEDGDGTADGNGHHGGRADVDVGG